VEERRAKIERVWGFLFAIQHAWGFGWMLVRAFLWSFVVPLIHIAGFVMAFIVLAGTVVFIAFLSCPLLRADTCPSIEIHDAKTGRILITEENMARFLQTVEAIRASMADVFAYLSHCYFEQEKAPWDAFQERVCNRFGDAGTLDWLSTLGGVYKI
jgi:hypothetical protein